MASQVSHNWGEDLAFSATGDLLIADDHTGGLQRVLRRLLTAAQSYIFHPEYGAGLSRFIGSVSLPSTIESAVRSQLTKEAVVSKTPPPSISVQPIPNGAAVSVQYLDAALGKTVSLSFNIDI
jgi:hypothetical protein